MKYLSSIACCFLVSACSNNNSEAIKSSNSPLNYVADSLLRQEIQSYLSDNKLDLKKVVITVDVGQTDSTAWYKIANTKTNPFCFDNKPFAYSNMQKAWVVFFFPNQNPFSTDKLMQDFNTVTRQDGLLLRNYLKMYSPATTIVFIHPNGKVDKTNF